MARLSISWEIDANFVAKYPAFPIPAKSRGQEFEKGRGMIRVKESSFSKNSQKVKLVVLEGKIVKLVSYDFHFISVYKN